MADKKIPIIITAEDYKTHYPADNYEIPKINQAITMAYETINYKYTANEIGRRWDLDQDKGGFTEEEKVHIQEAFFVQSRYNLQTGLQAQRNTLQRSSGSQNVSIAIPQRDSVYETVIYCLELAHVTTMLQGASLGINGLGCSEFDFARFVTWDKGNQVYVKNQYIDTEEAEFKKNTVLTYDNNAGSYWVRFSDFAKKILPTYKKGNLYYNGKTLEWLDTDTYLKNYEGFGLGRTLTVVNVGSEEEPQYELQWTFGQGVTQDYVDKQDSLVFKNSKEYTDKQAETLQQDIDDNTTAINTITTQTIPQAITTANQYTDNKISEIKVPTKTSDLTNDSGFITADYHDSTKQETLINQQNIKSINGQSLLGSGNIEVGGGGDLPTPPTTGTYVLKSINGVLTWVEEEPEYEGLCFTAQEDNSSVSYTITGELPDISIQYSYSDKTWHDWTANETISLMNNEKLYVRNTANTLSTSTSNYFQFVMNGKIGASGNVNSMINFAGLTDYCFEAMFYQCSSLTEAPELPATNLKEHCYDNMFHSCASLTKAPELPATKLASYCYLSMFGYCSSLTQAPELPATTLANYCYINMFYSCSSLKINENGEGTKIFTCPDTTGLLQPTASMFANTGGSFTGTPTAGNTYNWYK